MTRTNGRLLKCAAIALTLSFVLTSLVPVANAYGWGRSIVMSSDLLLTHIGAGDVDRDGADEVYTATAKGRIFRVLFTGSQWTKDELPSTPDSVKSMMVGDLNGDGYDEIYIAAQHSVDNGRLYRMTYNGATWSSEIIYKSFSSSNYPMALAIGDANSDGRRDLYWVEAGGALRFIYSDISGWTTGLIDTKSGGYFRAIAVGDGDGDNMVEVYVGTDDDKVLRYYFNGMSWSSMTIGDAGYDSYWDYVVDLVIGDPDHDGTMDVVATIGDRELLSFKYTQGGWKKTLIWGLTEISSLYKLTMGDADADGKEELFGTASNNTVYYYPWYDDLQSWGRTDVSMGSLPDEARSVVVTEADGEPDYKEIYVPCENGKVYRFSRDVDPPPPPLVWSPTHPVGTWRNVTIVKMEWRLQTDDQSGILGYSYAWFDGIPYTADETLDLDFSKDSLESSEFGDSDEIYFSIRALDGAGNWGMSALYGPIYIDSTPPDYAEVTISNGDTYTKSVLATLTLKAHDTLSGLANMSFSNDRTHWSEWVPYQETYTGWDLNQYSPGGMTDGPRTVYMRVQDVAGNVAPPVKDDIILDQTPPRGLGITINDGERYTQLPNVQLKLVWEETNEGSRISAMSFSNDNNLWGPWEEVSQYRSNWNLVTDPGGWDRDGEHKVYFRIIDEAGNIGGPAYAPVVLDRTPPSELNIVANGGELVSKLPEIALTLKATDKPEYNGLGYMAFREEGGDWTDWKAWNSKATFTVTNWEGMKIIYFKAKDKAGNEANPVKTFVVYDTAAPRISHVRVLGISDKGAVVTWATDIPANGLVRYGTTQNYNSNQAHSDLVTDHAVTLSGLRPNTEYHFSVESTDSPGVTPTKSRDMTFTTKDTADTIPPTITDLRVDGLTSSTAVVSWKTDEPSDTRLRYGESPVYDLVEGDSKDRLDHRVVLRNLQPSKTYYFLAQSSDNRGNGPDEAPGSFITLDTPDTDLPTISNLKVIGVTDTLAIVTWNTNEPTIGVIEYGEAKNYGQVAISDRYEKAHKVVLTGLKPDTMYHLIIRAIDVVGNGPTTSEEAGFFTSKTADRSPPVITNIKVDSVTSSTAVISWATDEPSDSAVEYSSSTAIGQTVYDLEMVEAHSIALAGLTPDTDYRFTVASMDASSNGPSVSQEMYFRTGKTGDENAPIITNLSVKGITNELAVIVWDTDKDSKCTVDYGTATGLYQFQVQEEGYFKAHSTVLWSLQPAVRYFARVQCSDPEGHGPTISDEVDFLTTNFPDKEAPEILDLKISNITENSAMVRWRTEEPSDSEIEFGKGDAMDQITRDRKYVFEHSLVLMNLAPNTTYRFVASSTDPSGNEGSGQRLDFTTKAVYVPPNPNPNPNPIPDNPTNTLESAMPWVAALLLILIIGLTVYMYRSGLMKMVGGPKDASTTARASAGTAARSPTVPPGMTDEGLCPHCHGHISLTAAATELNRARVAEEERKRQDAEAERMRQASVEAQREAQRQRTEAREHRLRATQAQAAQARTQEGTFEELPPGPGVEPSADAQDELADLYAEVEREEQAKRARARPDVHGAKHHAHHGLTNETSPRQTPKGAPMKTVKCGHCGGRVPVYTDKRPVRITCPSCSKSGTLKGP